MAEDARYYLGKPCKTCGDPNRYVKGQHCVTCCKNTNKERRESRPTEYREAIQRSIQLHPETNRESKKRWRDNNPDKAKAAIDRWRKEHPEKQQHYHSMRRAQKQNAPGSHTIQEWIDLKAEYGNVCLRCKVSERELMEQTGRGLNEDHIIPLCDESTSNDINNIQPLCWRCNKENFTVYQRTGTQVNYRLVL